MQLIAWEVSADYYTRLPGIVCLLTLIIIYIQAVTSHTQGRFNDHTEHRLYRLVVTLIRVVGEMIVGNIAPRAGIEPISLTFHNSVLPLYLGSLMSPCYLCISLSERSVQTTAFSSNCAILWQHLTVRYSRTLFDGWWLRLPMHPLWKGFQRMYGGGEFILLYSCLRSLREQHRSQNCNIDCTTPNYSLVVWRGMKLCFTVVGQGQ